MHPSYEAFSVALPRAQKKLPLRFDFLQVGQPGHTRSLAFSSLRREWDYPKVSQHNNLPKANKIMWMLRPISTKTKMTHGEKDKRSRVHFCIEDGGKNLLSFCPNACPSVLPIPDMPKMQVAGTPRLQLLQHLRRRSKSTDCFNNLPRVQSQNSRRIPVLP